jgi:hypothetical protein
MEYDDMSRGMVNQNEKHRRYLMMQSMPQLLKGGKDDNVECINTPKS